MDDIPSVKDIHIEDVEITGHAHEMSDSRMNLPESIIEDIVLNMKGMIFFDRKHESLVFQKDKTAIAVKVEEATAYVITTYRRKSMRRYKKDRFERLN